MYRGNLLVRTKREAQQDFILDYGQNIQEKFLINTGNNSADKSIILMRSLNEERAYNFVFKLGDSTRIFTPQIKKMYGL